MPRLLRRTDGRAVVMLVVVALVAAACEQTPMDVQTPQDPTTMLDPVFAQNASQMTERNLSDLLNGQRSRVFTPDEYEQYGLEVPSIEELRAARGDDGSTVQEVDCDPETAVIPCDDDPSPPPPGGPDPSMFDFDSFANAQQDKVGAGYINLVSFSESFSSTITHFTLGVSYRDADAEGPEGCDVTTTQFDSNSLADSEVGRIEDSRVAVWSGTKKWEVFGDHSFRDSTGRAVRDSAADFCGF